MAYSEEQYFTADHVYDVLDTLDYLCMQRNIKAKLLLLGGAGILLAMDEKGQEFRSTRDLDMNLLATNNDQELRALLSEVNIDLVGGVMELPPGEEMRKEEEEIFELDHDFNFIQVFVPSLEHLACTKIFTTRAKDLSDLTNTKLLDNCNMDKLLKMVNDYKNYLLNPNNPDLNYHQLDNILKAKGI